MIPIRAAILISRSGTLAHNGRASTRMILISPTGARVRVQVGIRDQPQVHRAGAVQQRIVRGLNVEGAERERRIPGAYTRPTVSST